MLGFYAESCGEQLVGSVQKWVSMTRRSITQRIDTAANLGLEEELWLAAMKQEKDCLRQMPPSCHRDLDDAPVVPRTQR